MSASPWWPRDTFKMSQITGVHFPALIQLGSRLSFAAGDVVYDDPNPGSWSIHENVVLIAAGHLAETLHDDDGKELMLGILARGDLVGLGKALRTGGLSRTTVTALTEGHGFTIPEKAFTGFLDEHRLWGSLAREMAQRLAWSHERLMEMTGASADRRLARILIELIGLDGEWHWDTIAKRPRPMTVPLTQAQIGTLIFVTRRKVERTLKDWRSRKIVTTGPRTITVHDLEKLAHLAGTTLAGLRSLFEPEPDGGCSRDEWRNTSPGQAGAIAASPATAANQ